LHVACAVKRRTLRPRIPFLDGTEVISPGNVHTNAKLAAVHNLLYLMQNTWQMLSISTQLSTLMAVWMVNLRLALARALTVEVQTCERRLTTHTAAALGCGWALFNMNQGKGWSLQHAKLCQV
jgi:hypothetical protein